MGGDDRDTILKRRAHFVAAALASAGVVGSPGCAKKDPPASPVTSVHVAEAGAESIEPDAGAPPVEPNANQQPDSGASSEDAGNEPATDAATPPKPPPRPCLSPPAPGHKKIKPQICLDFVN